jgi:hypothetical protein
MPYAKPNTDQSNLFGQNESWKEVSVRINFANADDLRKFADLIGQPITTKTASVWYPAQAKELLSDKRYVDES